MSGGAAAAAWRQRWKGPGGGRKRSKSSWEAVSMERKVEGPWCGWWAVAVSMESAVSSDSPMAAASAAVSGGAAFFEASSPADCASSVAALVSNPSALPPPPPPHRALLSPKSLHEHQLTTRLHTSLASIPRLREDRVLSPPRGNPRSPRLSNRRTNNQELSEDLLFPPSSQQSCNQSIEIKSNSC